MQYVNIFIYIVQQEQELVSCQKKLHNFFSRTPPKPLSRKNTGSAESRAWERSIGDKLGSQSSPGQNVKKLFTCVIYK